MKEYVLRNYKGLLLVVIAVLIMGVIEFQNINNTHKIEKRLSYEILDSANVKVLSKNDKIKLFMEENNEKIIFYARTFNISYDNLKELLSNNKEIINLKDIEVDKYLINYLLEKEKENPSIFNSKVNDNHSKEYILALIQYFTTIYTNVDYSLSSAIGEIESGYRSKYMISCNNIFGGMSGGKLIKYKTIEYGILRYIKLLNDSYYSKGLKTISDIGRKYNPIINENGVKIANPTWVKNVSNAIIKYQNNTDNVTIDLLNDLQYQVK